VIVYEWTQRHHSALYDGTRLVLVPALTCLACNALLLDGTRERVACPECGAFNRVGSALGHPTAIGLESA
jgi:phage FluMu protein Com